MSTQHYESAFVSEGLPALTLVRTPRYMRLSARALLVMLVMLLVGMLGLPWQQTATGTGQIIAFAPDEREQPLTAPISGVIAEWKVVEGARVKKGEVVVELRDNDPDLLKRLERERVAYASQIRVTEQAIDALDKNLAALTRMREVTIKSAAAKTREAQQSLKAEQQKLKSFEAKHNAAKLNETRQTALNDQGLVSDRKREQTIMKEATARADVYSARAKVEASRAKVFAAQADQIKAESEADAKLAKARSDQQVKRADLEKYRASLAKIETKLARQNAMTVRAPRDGIVRSVLRLQGGEYVKSGEPLAVLVPDAAARAVEVWVSGNDAPLVVPGRHVRLQFEGWPAVQFSGWPSVAVGTFGGTVAFVDAASDAKGKFRVVIRPDDGEQWPDGLYLRQGARVNAWILLNEVRLGYEMWRQLNGFPAAVDTNPISHVDKKKQLSAKKKGGGEDKKKDDSGEGY